MGWLSDSSAESTILSSLATISLIVTTLSDYYM